MNIKERFYQIASVNMKNKCSPTELEDFAEALVAELAKENKPVAVPEGWVVVPIETTPEMEKAGGHVNSEWLNDAAPIGEVRYGFPMPGVWKAMIAAAPQPEPVDADLRRDVERKNEWNRKIRDLVDNLLKQAGYAADSSARNLLSMMNFDAAMPQGEQK